MGKGCAILEKKIALEWVASVVTKSQKSNLRPLKTQILKSCVERGRPAAVSS